MNCVTVNRNRDLALLQKGVRRPERIEGQVAQTREASGPLGREEERRLKREGRKKGTHTGWKWRKSDTTASARESLHSFVSVRAKAVS